MNSKLLPANRSKGIIAAVHVAAQTADVMLIANQNTVVKNVPLASHINPNKVAVGNRCKLDFFDEKNTADMVVAYIYGTNYSGTKFKSGYAQFTGNGSIAHGLGVIPDIYGVFNQVVANGSGYYLYQDNTNPADNVNIYVLQESGHAVVCYWFAIAF